ncbi:RS3 [Hepatospora eriocheir]|nr:RS3 [Hepatospora eriocheir]
MIRQAFMENKPHKKIINSAFRAVDAAKGQGCSIKISGKLRGQRAKSTNYIHGVLIQAGQPAKDYIRLAKSEAMCKQGVIGIQVKIMLPYDPEGVKGPSKLLSDKIIVRQ